jgi:hypothetical protein
MRAAITFCRYLASAKTFNKTLGSAKTFSGYLELALDKPGNTSPQISCPHVHMKLIVFAWSWSCAIVPEGDFPSSLIHSVVVLEFCTHFLYWNYRNISNFSPHRLMLL